MDLTTSDLSITDRQARESLIELVTHVFLQEDDVLEKLTYEQLAERIGRFNKNNAPAARGMGHHVLGCLGKMLADIGARWGVRIPYIQTVVVQKSGADRGLPDVGVKGLWPQWEAWPRPQKENTLRLEYAEILKFGDSWNDVLRCLELPPVGMARTVVSGHTPRGGSGGESAQHKALKRYLIRNPQILGLDDTWKATEEWALPSGDKIDLMFQSPQAWLGVEVKSIVSDRDLLDYQRGIYQVVKYRAVLRAMGNAEAGMDLQVLPKTGAVRVLLVLEGKMPDEFRPIALANNVTYLEKIVPTPELH